MNKDEIVDYLLLKEIIKTCRCGGYYKPNRSDQLYCRVKCKNHFEYLDRRHLLLK